MDLKFTSKSLQRQSKKCEKEEKAQKLKIKKAMEKGNIDGARICAENAIRKRNEQMNYLRLSSRLDAVVARLDTQAKMQTVSKSMGSIVKSLNSSLTTGNNFLTFFMSLIFFAIDFRVAVLGIDLLKFDLSCAMLNF